MIAQSEEVRPSQALPPAAQDFERIIEAHQAMVFRTLVRLVGRANNVEDHAQDVFLRLYRALPGFRGDAQLETYLYRITVNVAQNEWKRLRRHDRQHAAPPGEKESWEDCLVDPAPGPAEHLQQAEFAAIVETHLNCLSPPERSTLILYHQEQRTYEQIAHILALPIGTVRTHLHRGRNKLREALLTAQPAARKAVR